MHQTLSLSTLLALLLCGFSMTAQAQMAETADRSVAAVQASAPEALEEAVASTEPEVAAPSAPSLTATAALPASTDVRPGTQVPQQFPAQRHITIGSATEQLLAMQRTQAAQRPRPIDGEQASRSYQRYLKSFETTIPEKFETGIDTGVGSN